MPKLTVRDATKNDVPLLAEVRGPVALHDDRIEYALGKGFRYLVLEQNSSVIGFACLVFQRPEDWSDADNTSCLPQIVDMFIAPQQRGMGFGSGLLARLEELCASTGYSEVFLSVNPLDNPKAHSLYISRG
jgi:GNAT superfamily N-acetyltransferase